MAVDVAISLSRPGDDVPDRARRAETLGFSYVACGEHVLFHRPTANAFVTLGAAAAVTRSIRLLTAITLLPLYPAALAAKLAASLDVLSGGRLDLGVGAGGEHPAEFAACGVDVTQRGRLLDTGLARLADLLGGGLGGTPAVDPPPVQARVPLWVGGRSAAARARAAAGGDGWLPYLVDPDQLRAGRADIARRAEAAGRAAGASGALRTGVVLFVTVSHRDRAGRAAARSHLERRYRQGFGGDRRRYLVAGSPERCRDQLGRFVAAGADLLVLIPAVAPEEEADAVERIAADLLPGLRPEGRPG